ncbi:MAG: hypothetical protein GXO14_03920 [Thermococci archaeon]|nr:hypothetical protein [Thermococci archaeon]
MGLQGSKGARTRPQWPIRGTIELQLPDEEIASVVYRSVLYEHRTVPYRRSRIEFRLDGSRIIISFLARDSSALRGTLNSYLRWIKVAMDSAEL